MGITIHYGGKIKSVDLIDELVDEMIEVSKVNEWKYHYFDSRQDNNLQEENAPPHLKGIAFGADESEAIWLTFDDNGVLLSPMVADFQHDSPEQSKNIEYNSFTKTQETGVDYHIKVVNLLKYVSNKYFMDWHVRDESTYYESEDRQQLVMYMNIINNSLAALNDAFDAHGDTIIKKSPKEIQDFIGKVLGAEAMDIKIIKIDDNNDISDDDDE